MFEREREPTMKKSRRAENGSGFWGVMPNGKPFWKFSFRDPITGVLKRKQISGNTKREVREIGERMIAESKRLLASTCTVGEWCRWWLDNHVGIEISTRDAYDSVMRNQIEPILGKVYLRDLNAGAVTTMLTRLEKAGFSGNYLRKVRSVLSIALRAAVMNGKVSVNVVTVVPLPRVKARRITVLSETDFLRFVRIAEDSAFPLGHMLLAYTGMRVGEALGLDWSRVNLKRREIHVCKTYAKTRHGFTLHEPKTRSSNRRIPIGKRLFEKLSETSPAMRSGPVVKSGKGYRVNPDSFRRDFRQLLKRLGISERARVHDLRHTWVAHQLNSGVEIVRIQEQLGHSSPATTMRSYGNLIPNDIKTRAERFESTFEAMEERASARSGPASNGADRFVSKRCSICGNYFEAEVRETWKKTCKTCRRKE